jgi:NADH-quinone oxidoreductase subunit C
MLDQIQLLIKDELHLEVSPLEHTTPAGFTIAPEHIHDVCQLLHGNAATYFDHLACLSGIDNGPEAGSMEVIYTLYSIPNDTHLTLKVLLDRSKPEVDSVADIWRGANWHEREAFDLFGITFSNHPDLRRILLPADWVGYPMRKDYVEDTTYHGLTIKHPDADRA